MTGNLRGLRVEGRLFQADSQGGDAEGARKVSIAAGLSVKPLDGRRPNPSPPCWGHRAFQSGRAPVQVPHEVAISSSRGWPTVDSRAQAPPGAADRCAAIGPKPLSTAARTPSSRAEGRWDRPHPSEQDASGASAAAQASRGLIATWREADSISSHGVLSEAYGLIIV